jgi:catechol 2,3-dioxygenase
MTVPTQSADATSAPAGSRPHLGHVALRVADLERATAFYRDLVGLELTAWGPDDGVPLAIFATGDHPLGLVLMAFERADGMAPPEGHTGLGHLALLLDGPEALAAAAKRLNDAGHPIDHASDHEATVSIYLEDTEGNGLELYYHRSRDRWFHADGRIVMVNEPLDLETILAAAAG